MAMKQAYEFGYQEFVCIVNIDGMATLAAIVASLRCLLLKCVRTKGQLVSTFVSK